MRNFDGGAFWVGCGWFFFGILVGGGRGRGRDNVRARTAGSFSLDDEHCQTAPFFMLWVVVIYYHLSKLSVGQTPRLCNLPSKSYSNNINVPYPGGNDLVKESGKPFNGIPLKFKT